MMTFGQFAHDYRCEYPTDEALKAAYDRRWRAEHDILLTAEEFKLETRTEPESDVGPTYEKLLQWEDAYAAMKTYHEMYPDDPKGNHEFEFLESRIAQ